MANFGKVLKDIFTTSVRFVNRTATSVASATKYKLDSLDNSSQRHEAIVELGKKVYSMYTAGVEMPEEALPLLSELRALEEGMVTLHDDRERQKAEAAKQREVEAEARRVQREADKVAAAEAAKIRAAERAALKQQREEAKAAAAAAKAAAAAAAAAAEAAEPVILPVENEADYEEPVYATEPIAEVEAPEFDAVEEEETPRNDEPMML